MRGGPAVLDEFNALPAAEARSRLLAVCAAPRWAQSVAAARPYGSAGELLDTGGATFANLTWDEIAEALAAHPRIGERPAGASREAAWSRKEQSGVTGSQDALAQANRAYEERFGHVFLIFASGKSAPEILAAARERLGHDEDTEREVVREELGKIVRLRLERLVDA